MPSTVAAFEKLPNADTCISNSSRLRSILTFLLFCGIAAMPDKPIVRRAQNFDNSALPGHPAALPASMSQCTAVSGSHRRSRTMSLSKSSPIPATLIPGDGIGPEITAATVKVLDALGAPFAWDIQHAGMAGIERGGEPLPETTLDSIRRTRLALKGPLTTPVGGGFRSVNVRLREEFGLYANVRPVRTVVPGGRFEKIDLVLIRENLE